MTHQPYSPPLQAHRWTILALAGIFFLAVFGYYYPSYFTSGDEQSYLIGAALLTNGSLVLPTNEYYCSLTQTTSGYSSTYPIGKSVVIIPFLQGGLNTLFWSGALIHILNFIIFISILHKIRVNKLWSLIYLFFPAFQWSSRTLFPELSVLTFFLLAYFAWLHVHKHSSFLTGFLLGIALFFRTDAILGMIAFGSQSLMCERKRFFSLASGFLIPLLALFAFNFSMYHSLLPQVGAASSLLGRTFGFSLVIEFITFLAILLLLAPPFSAWAIRRDKNHFILFAVLVLVTSLFFVRFYSFWALGTTIPHILTVRLRYFIPAIGLLLIPAVQFYSHVWSRRIHPFLSERIPVLASSNALYAGVALFFLCASIGTIYLHHSHEELLDSRKIAWDAIHDTIPTEAKVVGSADDCIYFLPELTGMKKYYPASQLPTNFIIDNNTYFLDISYATQRDTGTNRQDVIDAERKRIKDLILAHAEQLEKIAEYRQGTWVTIWRGKPV